MAKSNVNLLQQGLNNEYQIAKLAKILERVIDRSGIRLSSDELNDIDADVLRSLRQKYPDAGISSIDQGAQNAGNQ